MVWRSTHSSRAGQEGGGDIGEEDQRERQEDLLHPTVRAAGDQQPDQHGRHRHGDVAADAEQLGCRGDADELGYDDAEIGDKQGQQDQRGCRSEKLSRTRSEKPLPVTAPIRALISCTTPTQIVTSTIAQSSP